MKNGFFSDLLGLDSPSENHHPQIQLSMEPRSKRRPLGPLTSLVNTFELSSVKLRLANSSFTKSMRMPEFPLFDRHDDTDEYDCDDDNDTTLNDDDLLLSPTMKSRTGLVRRPHSLIEGQPDKVDAKDFLHKDQLQKMQLFEDCSSLLAKSGVSTFTVSNDLIPRIDEAEMKRILDGCYTDLFDEYIVIDCRFPYEFEGGHIANAVNIALQSDLEERFVVNGANFENKRKLLIFHCEYSIFRGPTMAGHLRKIDRIYNSDRYPYLLYPDIVVLEGGYKRFFDRFKLHCIPQAYVEMKDTKHKRTCEVEMSKVLQMSKLTRAKSFNQFQPRLTAAHARLSSFTQLLSLSEQNLTLGATPTSRKSRTSKIHKKDRRDTRSQFTQLLMSLPSALDGPRLDYPRLDLPVSLAFEDDFAPPPTLFRNHSKSLSNLLMISVHSSLLLVCSESFSAFSLSDSLLESCSPFADYDYFDGTTMNNSGNLLSSALLSSYSFPTSQTQLASTPFAPSIATPFSGPLPSKNKARLTLARPGGRSSQHLSISSPTVSSPLTGMPSSTFELTNSTHTISLDVINDSEVEFSLPKHTFSGRKDLLSFIGGQRDTLDIDEAEEESDSY